MAVFSHLMLGGAAFLSHRHLSAPGGESLPRFTAIGTDFRSITGWDFGWSGLLMSRVVTIAREGKATDKSLSRNCQNSFEIDDFLVYDWGILPRNFS